MDGIIVIVVDVVVLYVRVDCLVVSGFTIDLKPNLVGTATSIFEMTPVLFARGPKTVRSQMKIYYPLGALILFVAYEQLDF